MRSSQCLIKCAKEDILPPIPVLVDYFGKRVFVENKVETVFGLYQFAIQHGLVKYINLEMNFKNNTLDQMLESIFLNYPENPYWKEYKAWGGKIGKTYFG